MSRKDLSPKGGRRALAEASAERERASARLVWKMALARYGSDGEGPIKEGLPSPDPITLARALACLASFGPSHGLPKGVDPELAAFVAGKELADEVRELRRGGPRRGGVFGGMLNEKGASAALAGLATGQSERGFELALSFVEGVSARLEGECSGGLFAFWLRDLGRASQAARLERLLRSGVSANAAGSLEIASHPLSGAFEGGDRACVEALLRYGADPELWERAEPAAKKMAQTGLQGFFWAHCDELFGLQLYGGHRDENPVEGKAGRGCPQRRLWRESRGGAPVEPGLERIALREGGPAQALAQAWLMEGQLAPPEDKASRALRARL